MNFEQFKKLSTEKQLEAIAKSARLYTEIYNDEYFGEEETISIYGITGCLERAEVHISLNTLKTISEISGVEITEDKNYRSNAYREFFIKEYLGCRWFALEEKE